MTLPDYASLTREDPNPVKRWLQARRLADALAALPNDLRPRGVVDYGSGDGALTARLAERFPAATAIAFEPAAEFAAAARAHLGERARVVETEAELPDGAADLLVCAEVFEHLPVEEETRALEQFERVLAPGGLLLIGLPIEVGPPALLKGLFRMARRRGEADAYWPAIRAAAAGKPALAREVVEIGPGRRFIPSHLGFDHRAFERRLAARFSILGRSVSPTPGAPWWASTELYLLARRRGDG